MKTNTAAKAARSAKPAVLPDDDDVIVGVEEVLEEWKDTGVKGFIFSFYTPIESIQDPLFPGWEQRDKIIDRLIELKKTKYGEFIRNDLRTLQLMKSESSKEVTDNCQFLTNAPSDF
mgnify:CR=1 FL=1